MKTTSVEKLLKKAKKDINTALKMLKNMANFETEDIGQETPIVPVEEPVEEIEVPTEVPTDLSVETPESLEETAPIE